MAAFDQASPKPAVARLLELVAAILELRDGRLELLVAGGRLVAWHVDGGVRGPGNLSAYDQLADELLARPRSYAPIDPP